MKKLAISFEEKYNHEKMKAELKSRNTANRGDDYEMKLMEYKDPNNNWVSPDEIETINGKKYLKEDHSKKIKVGPSESMSKSKRNTIDPEKIMDQYGADAVRLFILSDSPPEKDVQWSEQGMQASYKFIQKLWGLNELILEKR